jgi:hypothetical protein
MYEIERKDGQVIIRRAGHAVHSISLASYIVYKLGEEPKVSKIKDLTDEQLLLALVSALKITGDTY